MDSIGIIAGNGSFPLLVARAARAAGTRVSVVGFSGHMDQELARAFQAEADNYAELKLGQLGKLIKHFKKQGVTRLTMAGAISKPKALRTRPDLRAVKLFFKARNRGDDNLLRLVIQELENEGFTVFGAADLVPDLRTPAGVLTRESPSEDEWDDLRFGVSVARQMGNLDIGQCVVIRGGMVAAVEGMEGTDATILRGGELAGPGSVVVKTVKPNQDKRVDLPAAGPETIRSLVKAKAACLGLEADQTLLLDRQETLALADKHKIAVVGLTPENTAE